MLQAEDAVHVASISAELLAARPGGAAQHGCQRVTGWDVFFWGFGSMSQCYSVTGWVEEAALKLNGMTKSCAQQVNIFFLFWWVIYLLVLMVRARSCPI